MTFFTVFKAYLFACLGSSSSCYLGNQGFGRLGLCPQNFSQLPIYRTQKERQLGQGNKRHYKSGRGQVSKKYGTLDSTLFGDGAFE